MGTKRRQGGTGLFSGACRTQRPKTSTAYPSPSAGITYAWELASDLLTWGPNAADALGLPPKDLPRTGRAFAQLVEPDSGTSRDEAITGDGAPSGAYDTRYALRFGTDRVIVVLDAGRWQPDMEGRPGFVRGHLRPDPGSSTADLLPLNTRTRSSVLLGIQNCINEALRVSHTCTLIVGSFEGDEAGSMEAVGRSLRPMMRRHDYFASLGPDRFALALACCPASEATGAMKRLSALLESHQAAASLHLGAACAPDHTFQPTKLLRFAEQALGLAIECRDTAVLHRLCHAGPHRTSDKVSFDLTAALNDRRLILACRPMVDAQTRIPALMQASAALSGPDGCPVLIGPVPRVEEANLALLVDGRMLELTADHLVRNADERIALPVSSETLSDPEWLPMLAAHLGARPGIESRLVLDIPEAALATGKSMPGRLDAMKALGIGLALTGFGAGHIPLSRLPSLPFDLLKLDGVFIQALKRSTDDRLHVRTLIDRAQNLGIATAAEWVDDEASVRLLAAWGVDYLQGAIFGEPQAVSQPSTLQQFAKALRA